MWHTPEGDRRLTGAEAELVRQALAIMVDRLSDNLRYGDGEDRLWDSGVTLFDELTATQQLIVIKQVVEHLLLETPDTLELTAVNEAAAYAIFATVAGEIEVEIDMAKEPLPDDFGAVSEWRTFWRQRVLDAYRETFPDAEGVAVGDEALLTLPPAESEDVAEWTDLTEHLADRILWDRDFEMGDSFLDTDPAQAAMMKQVLGIESDYYTAIAEEARAEDAAALLASVRQITHVDDGE